MADPLSIVAILALVYAGRKLSTEPREPTIEEVAPEEEPNEVPSEVFRAMSRLTDSYINPGMPSVGGKIFHKTETPSFALIAPSKPIAGAPFTPSREYVSPIMNNVGPVPKINVGPGLGLDPSVPTAGGFHQFYRVLPNNVGAYRLTTLPGRINIGGDITGGMPGLVGDTTKYGPAKTAYLPTRYPTIPGRSAVTAPVMRQSEEKTKRPTARAETSFRSDGLQYAPAKSMIPAQPLAQNPTRNKDDLTNKERFPGPAPGISSFIGGFTNTPEAKILAAKRPDGGFTAEELASFGIRVPTGSRGKKDRMGNPGQKNVQANALDQSGMLTTLRSDVTRIDGRVGPGNVAWKSMQDMAPMYQDNNPYKGNMSNLDFDLAKKQLAGNPLVVRLTDKFTQ